MQISLFLSVFVNTLTNCQHAVIGRKPQFLKTNYRKNPSIRGERKMKEYGHKDVENKEAIEKITDD